jgi:hypothetical protein
MVKINSSNPPGNETVVAKYIQGVLEREGIPSKLVGADPNRLSLIARLKGSGAKKPIPHHGAHRCGRRSGRAMERGSFRSQARRHHCFDGAAVEAVPVV